jgi:hypothetical protein
LNKKDKDKDDLNFEDKLDIGVLETHFEKFYS